MPTSFAVPLNNIATTIGSAYTAGSGSLVLASGTGSAFGSAFPVRFTVVTAATWHTSAETLTVYQCTGRTADTLTGLTVVEGSTDRAYAVADKVEVRITAGSLSDVHLAVNTLETALPLKALDTAVVHLAGAETISGAKAFATMPTHPVQLANVVYAGPSSGGSTAPAFRALAAADVPDLSAVYASLAGSYANPTWITSLSGGKLTGNVVATNGVITVGQAGGQTINGGTAASDNLTLVSTANATKGNISLAGLLVDSSGYAVCRPITFLLAMDGNPLAVANNVTQVGSIVGFAGKLVRFALKAAVNSGGYTVVVKNAGVTVLTQTIADAVTTVTNGTLTGTVAAGDELTINVTAAGSSVKYVNVTIYALIGNQ